MPAPVFDDCPDVTHEMADAAHEAMDATLLKMGVVSAWSSLVPMYYAVQSALDAKAKAGAG